jgi:hypothetical protein
LSAADGYTDGRLTVVHTAEVAHDRKAEGASRMEESQMTGVTEVAACTRTAAHRRDHDHDLNAGDCHPHVVEVVHLGNRAITVCHDCHLDSGFIPRGQAEALAARHRELTRDISVELLSA